MDLELQKTVKTINGTEPDKDGNVEIVVGGLTEQQKQDIATAKTESSTAKQQVEAVSGQLINAKNESIQATRTNGKRRCIVSFISDDSYIEDYTILKPIFQPHNIPCCCAVISSYAGRPNQLTDTHLAELHSLGWEFSAHTHNHFHLPTLTRQQQDDELRISKEFLEKKGYKCDYIVYPFGEYNQDTLDVARKYFRFGFTTGASVADYPTGTYTIKRVSLGAYFDAPTKNTLEYYKSKFDEAYANNKWIIFMLHPHDPAFDATQQQHLKDLITYIKTFNVPFMTAGDAYNEMGNMVTVGDGQKEKLVITNTGDIKQTPEYSTEITSQSSAWKTGTGTGQTTPVDFVDAANIKLRMQATSPMTNPSVISVGKNVWGGLKAANDIITSVNDPTLAYFTIVDGRRCIALKGSINIQKVFFSKGFIPGTQYALSGTWRRDVSATGNGGTLRFKHTDDTYTGTVHAASTTWADFSFGSSVGKSVSTIEGTYGSNGNIVYIDLDTLQVEIGVSKSTFEVYKESRLDITASIAINDMLTFENNKLYKNADQVTFANSIKAYKNGTIYVSDGTSPSVYITYPLNAKAAQDLANSQVIAK
ncbi:putative polysaccharide deacetylase [Bacillus phage BCP8-2]|uniref:Putative polysaccharide deacetylase n=1 Tax=Bacillus phage BCP8-2 TaxID=1129192 RepID=A0A0E3D9F7_9CAUD|nr:putative polysaccharide deacetylase [Bacillus phage BCP8-2]AHJ87077.1 putative polysaccharide deacetylase [Bacillus phage BCP8-2]